MKSTLISIAASVGMVSLSAGAFASTQLDRIDSGSTYNNGAMKLAQATGTGTTGGTGKNNTVEEQTGKATSSSPNSMDPKDVTGSTGKTGTVPPAAPDNRNPSPMGTSDPSGPTVK